MRYKSKNGNGNVARKIAQKMGTGNSWTKWTEKHFVLQT